MDDHDEPPAPIGWPRALLTTAVIVVVAIGIYPQAFARLGDLASLVR